MLTFGAPYCKLYSRDLIEKHKIHFPESYSYGEDTTFFLKVLSVTKRIVTNSKCNYHYVDAVVGSLSKKEHDYEPLKMFLEDSINLIKGIDMKFHTDGRLIKSYENSYINLTLRSVVNMYRLGYSYTRKRKCFNDIKSSLLSLIECPHNIAFNTLRYIPTSILIVLFNFITKIRK